MLQNVEPHHPGDAGPGSGRTGGSRAKGEGDGDGTEDPTQCHQREEGDGKGPCPGAWLVSAGKKYLFRNLF